MAGVASRHRVVVLIFGVALIMTVGGIAAIADGGIGSTRRSRPRLTDSTAYGLVVPPCAGCRKLPKNFTPFRSTSRSVVLATTPSGAPVGTWCFVLKNSNDLSTATVVPSVVSVESPRAPRFHLEEARWIVGAPNCATNQIEIRTFGYTVEGGSLVAVPNQEIAFSFAAAYFAA